MKKIIVYIFVVLSLTSCEELRDDNIIPADAARLTKLQQDYKDVLVGATDGWYFEYTPSSTSSTVSILAKFFEDGTVKIISDFYGFTSEKTSTYRIGGVVRPELIFDTYSVFSKIAEVGNGKFEFLIFPNGNSVELKHVDGTNTSFIARRATDDDLQTIADKTIIASRLQDFNVNVTAYFKNLLLTNVSAFWDIDVSSQRLTLTWDANGTVQTKTFSYSNLNDGIRLAEDWVVGSVVVREFIFDNFSQNSFEVISAGNAGSGLVSVSHVPAFPYANAAERYINSNRSKPNETFVRLLGYTADRNSISDALKPYYDAITNAIPTFWRVQVYNADPALSNPSITLVGKNEANTNVFYYFYYTLLQQDASHVIPSYVSANGNAQPVVSHPDIQAFLTRLYPPQGVTIIPLASQRIRVVSRANSMHYIDLVVSTPTGIWSN